jgi:hypothetical protein
MGNQMNYKHVIQVELVTQFPKDKDSLADLVQQMLGPWCEKATTIETNIRLDQQESKS